MQNLFYGDLYHIEYTFNIKPRTVVDFLCGTGTLNKVTISLLKMCEWCLHIISSSRRWIFNWHNTFWVQFNLVK